MSDLHAAGTGAPFAARILTLSVGTVGELPYKGRTIRSAFAKKPVGTRIEATKDGLAGDEQGDRVKHGGPDKAVCVFPAEHYPHYERLLGRPLARPAFGENLTTSGLDEHEVCIGDVFRVGDAVLQVTLPRNPCYRLAARYGVRELPLWFERSGRTGFYLRVLQEGRIGAGDRLEPVERPHPRATVAEANRLMHHDKRDLPAIRVILVPELGQNWRRTFERRLSGTIEDPSRRRYGPAAPLS
ncbi:MOSC domain-containing protein [Actinomadura sp. GC306]|uniref:MOSC domain-containing protein n=1 Tax=Actinomadura sp. GC306 TaxID=2530367 RepID=UPI0010501E38|nr:MOSC domain-containing protein [Actinomadura sp. GC306]TDC67684.1 MOSC domain-containing protein [Actinomadura sp. GC306]